MNVTGIISQVLGFSLKQRMAPGKSAAGCGSAYDKRRLQAEVEKRGVKCFPSGSDCPTMVEPSAVSQPWFSREG